MGFFRKKADPYALPELPAGPALPKTAPEQIQTLLGKGWQLNVKHDGAYTSVLLTNEDGDQRANFDLKNSVPVPSTDTVYWAMEQLAPEFYRLPTPKQALILLALAARKPQKEG